MLKRLLALVSGVLNGLAADLLVDYLLEYPAFSACRKRRRGALRWSTGECPRENFKHLLQTVGDRFTHLIPNRSRRGWRTAGTAADAANNADSAKAASEVTNRNH